MCSTVYLHILLLVVLLFTKQATCGFPKTGRNCMFFYRISFSATLFPYKSQSLVVFTQIFHESLARFFIKLCRTYSQNISFSISKSRLDFQKCSEMDINIDNNDSVDNRISYGIERKNA